MHSREVVDLLTDDDAEVLEAHPVDTLVNGGMSSMRETGVPSRTSSGSASTIKEIGRPFQTFSRFALAWRSRSVRRWTYRSHRRRDGEVAERVGRDVDAAGQKTIALHRREGSIVADDLGDRIRRRHVASSSAIVRDAWTLAGSSEVHGRPHPVQPDGRYEGSSRKATESFKAVLDRARIPRRCALTRGRDIEAACGQLAERAGAVLRRSAVAAFDRSSTSRARRPPCRIQAAFSGERLSLTLALRERRQAGSDEA